MRVRIVAHPELGKVDEYDIRRRFKIGQTYELPLQLATMLIIAGYAEAASGGAHAEAADTGVPRSRRKKP